jgi:disulfide reductase
MKYLAACVLAVVGLVQVAVADDGPWLTDLSKAQAEAKQNHKMVLMDFNGSDWCPPCKILKKQVLSSPEFLEFAKKNLVLVDVDFPHFKELPGSLSKANEALAQKYDVDGFPTIIVLSSSGKQLEKEVGYGGQTAKEFVAQLKKLNHKP